MPSRTYLVILFALFWSLSYITQPIAAQDYTPLVSVNAGGADIDGTWEEDSDSTPSPYLLAGSANIETIKSTPTKDSTVPSDIPLAVFETKRIDADQPEPYMEWAFSQFSYTSFLVEFFFVEMSRCSVGNRIFDVEINGTIVLDDFDVYTEAGNQCNVGIARSIELDAPDGQITIRFPIVNGKPSTVAGIRISGASEVENGTLSVLPTTIDFGYVAPGETSAPVLVTLTNEGTGSISVEDIQLTEVAPHQFSSSGLSGPIPGGGTAEFELTFSASDQSSSATMLSTTPLFRVNAGGTHVADDSGDWVEDTESNPSTYLAPGTANIETTTGAIVLDPSVPLGTPIDLFSTKRIDANKADPVMSWDFPVTSGEEYQVNLFFTELSRCSAGNRVFDVELEGALVYSALDIYSEAGGCNVGIMKTFTVAAADTNLDIDFPLNNGKPSVLAGIEIISLGDGGDDDPVTEDITGQATLQHNGSNEALVIDLLANTDEGASNLPPTAAYTYAADGLTVDFTDTSTDSDGSIISWNWDFGEGTTSSEQHPAHTYGAAGSYTVFLTVTDNDGAISNTWTTLTVDNPDPESITVSLPTLQKSPGFSELVLLTVNDVSAEFFISFNTTITYDPDILEISGVDTTSTLISGGSIIVNNTIPGEIVIAWANSLQLSGSGTLINLDVTYLAEGTSPLTFSTFVFNEGSTPVTTIDGSVEVSAIAGTGAFLETGGLVVMEAEHAHSNLAKNGQSWEEVSENAGFSGLGYMVSTPDIGEVYNTSELDISPELQFEVNFTTTGLYNFWSRITSLNTKSNTMHIGVNGEIHADGSTPSATTDGSWTWQSDTDRQGVNNQFEILEPGVHTISVWVREDGVLFDKILLTTDSEYTPEDEGPAESPKDTATSLPGKTLTGTDLAKGHTDSTPIEFALRGNYPNPFNPRTTIRFDVPESSSVRLEVFDMMGRQVATLVDASYSAGQYEVQWNATNDAGEQVASGIYVYRMQAGQFESVSKMVLMK